MSYEPSTVKEIFDRDHGYLKDTPDGLSEEDRKRGYHYYGAYKVYHACQKCDARREVVAYDRGWVDSGLCQRCCPKVGLGLKESHLGLVGPGLTVKQEWTESLSDTGFEFGQLFCPAGTYTLKILGYDREENRLWADLLE